MTPPYQQSGSPSSLDVDVVFFVDQLTSIKASSQLGKYYGEQLGRQLGTTKAINVNLAVLGKQGHLTHVYKGTTDELNNALIATYQHHPQIYLQHITQALPRDLGLKVLRCARVIISFLSRTALRVEIKAALRGNLMQKLAILKKIHLTDFNTLGKHGKMVSFYKTASFQLGQSLALADGNELYTKEEIANYYPNLATYLQRKEGQSADALQNYLTQFIELAYQLIPSMKSLVEYSYK